MNFPKSILRAIFASILLLAPAALLAQTNCEEGAGPLNTAQPQGITTQEIIQQFAAKEELFREARNNYAYTQDITVQTLDGNTVDGEYRLVQDITYNDKGERIENVTFAPQSTLVRVGLGRDDFDDIRRVIANRGKNPARYKSSCETTESAEPAILAMQSCPRKEGHLLHCAG